MGVPVDLGSSTSSTRNEGTKPEVREGYSDTTSSNSTASSGSNAGSSTTQASGDRQLTKEEAEKLYEENMELEYAKREGGA